MEEWLPMRTLLVTTGHHCTVRLALGSCHDEAVRPLPESLLSLLLEYLVAETLDSSISHFPAAFCVATSPTSTSTSETETANRNVVVLSTNVSVPAGRHINPVSSKANVSTVPPICGEMISSSVALVAMAPPVD